MSQVNHSRKTIGVLLDAGYYIESFNALYWPGAADFAQDHGINLIVFVGRSATTFYGEAEYMYNISTKFISPDIVDGLVILSGSLADGMGIEGVRDVCKQYESIPKVCISLPIDDVPCVMIDNKAGFEELLTHLITIHDYKRIAFLKGTPKTYDAEERFDVYCKTLEKFNIPIDDELIVHGEFSYESGVDAVNILIEQRNVLFDVLVCSDDDSALGALDEFKRLGIHVPDDVAITGFDNINEVQYITPPLTTVTQPFYEQSKKACELVLAMIHGEGVPKRTYLSTELVLRQSCGCFSDSILELKPIVSCETSYSEIAQKIVTAKSSVIELVLAKFTEETIISKNLNRWLEKLYDALVENFKDFNDNYFVRQINNFVSHFEQKGRDRENRRKLIMSLYESLLLDVGSKDTTKFIDFFFKKAMILLNENLSRNKAYDKLSIEKAIWKTHLIGQILITTLELDTLMDHITQLLPLLGIKSCYLNFYVKERKSNPERFEIPKRSTLMCAYNTSGRIMIPEDGIEFDTLDLMPQEIFFKAGRRSYIFTALFFGKEQLGFMLFEYGPRIELVYESLRKNISSAIKACLLFKEQELIKKKLLVANYNLHDEIKQHIVTEKKLEEASKAKSEFLANMSHEIRTPMNSILGFTSLLLEEEEEEKKRNALRIINRSGKNLLNLINNILDFSKIEAGKIDLEEKPFNLVYSLKHVYNMFRLKAKKVKLRFRLKIDPRLNGAFLGDEFRIEQILINILSNAFKFTSEGEIRFICRYVDEKVVLSISDTGIGIPPDKQKQIFESFTQADTSTTRKYGGTGLGLSITLSLIRKMGGTIEVKSKPDRGSRFTIILPLEKTSDEWEEDTYEELMPVEVPSENNIEDPGVFTVLVADDNEMNRRLVGALLSGIGVTYETAENGQAVLNKLEECVLTNTPLYDLILLDMQMPVMDGIETIKRIRNDERFKEMYVIALTAFALKEEREECLRAGCDDYIAKPMDKDLFRRKINEQMQSGNL